MKELLTHVGLTYKDYTTELKEGLENLSLVDPTAPDNPAEGNQVAFEIWKMDVKEYHEKLKVLLTSGQDSTVLFWDSAPMLFKSA